ncbi:hypothetical protein [Paludisphaera rhizosphaerae]|uniref:hypothetical protein n=1 Tax=Paludisphaera rhizosphaerae TaxID=2711216 RepID=UPI0013EDEF45|nr:hypothetical protein [Paludisphaera rhizosphaerae]
MPTIAAVIDRMFPEGTNPSGGGPVDRTQAPQWPPDAFAVAATLVGRSGCYSRPESTGLQNQTFDEQFVDRAERLGRLWAGELDVQSEGSRGPVSPREAPELFHELEALWSVLTNHRELRISDSKAEVCWRAALQLMAIADEACRGVGFASIARKPKDAPSPKTTRLMALVHAVNLEREANITYGPSDQKFSLPYLPNSLCRMVPPDEACVHPKTRAPRAGITLRSFSHYLALVPPIGEVESSWRNVNEGIAAESPAEPWLNVLVVPFPYHVPKGCFRVGRRTSCDAVAELQAARDFHSFFFDAEAKWLKDQERALDPKALGHFLVDLVKEANAAPQGGRVDVMVLPELALEANIAEKVAEILAERTSLNMFVSGVYEQPADADPINAVDSYLLFNGEVVDKNRQTKHHRWKLDPRQCQDYELGPDFDALQSTVAAAPAGQDDEPDPDFDARDEQTAFWEHIDITRRTASFWVFRPGVSVTTLICEDLARVDPVHTYIRTIGPTLVIALLMDAAQKRTRWPGRYATNLRDDPGSSVLTVSSLGMIRLVRKYYDAEAPQAVAFWADEHVARELWLDPGSHALLLKLKPVFSTNYTLDGRGNDGRTISLRLPSHEEGREAEDAFEAAKAGAAAASWALDAADKAVRGASDRTGKESIEAVKKTAIAAASAAQDALKAAHEAVKAARAAGLHRTKNKRVIQIQHPRPPAWLGMNAPSETSSQGAAS